MHIALVNPQGNFDPADSFWTEHPDFGGQLVYVKEIAINLAAHGHFVDILTRRMIDPDWAQFSQPLDAYPEVKNVRIIRIPCGPQTFLSKEKLWEYLGLDWVMGILQFYQQDGTFPEVFSAHYGDGGLSAVLLAHKTGRPITFTGHSLSAQKMDKLRASPENIAALDMQYAFSLRLPAERLSMNHADRIITSTRQEQIHQYGHHAYAGAVDTRDSSRFSIIPPGVNLEIFSTEPGPADKVIEKRITIYLKKDILPDRRQLPLILASSRLDTKKNLSGLVRAFGLSPELQKAANLAIAVRSLEDPLHEYSSLSAAEQAIMQEITNLIREFSLDGKITAFPLNSQAELAAAYRLLTHRRSVFVLPALYEPFGLAPLEAMSCGLPAAVTRNGGPSESMHENGQFFASLFDPENPADMARGILEVLSSEDAWKRYSSAGRKRVHAQYTWQQTAKEYESVFQEIIESGHQPGSLPVPGWFQNPASGRRPDLNSLQERYFQP